MGAFLGNDYAGMVLGYYSNACDLANELEKAERWERWQRFFKRVCPLWDFAPNPLPILARAVNAVRLHGIRFQPRWRKTRWKSKT